MEEIVLKLLCCAVLISSTFLSVFAVSCKQMIFKTSWRQYSDDVTFIARTKLRINDFLQSSLLVTVWKGVVLFEKIYGWNDSVLAEMISYWLNLEKRCHICLKDVVLAERLSHWLKGCCIGLKNILSTEMVSYWLSYSYYYGQINSMAMYWIKGCHIGWKVVALAERMLYWLKKYPIDWNGVVLAVVFLLLWANKQYGYVLN